MAADYYAYLLSPPNRWLSSGSEGSRVWVRTSNVSEVATPEAAVLSRPMPYGEASGVYTSQRQYGNPGLACSDLVRGGGRGSVSGGYLYCWTSCCGTAGPAVASCPPRTAPLQGADRSASTRLPCRSAGGTQLSRVI
jgi:hypothetical protein